MPTEKTYRSVYHNRCHRSVSGNTVNPLTAAFLIWFYVPLEKMHILDGQEVEMQRCEKNAAASNAAKILQLSKRTSLKHPDSTESNDT